MSWVLREGGMFGDYRVVRRLGKGGMGEVWLLQSASGGLVAAKILDSTDHEARRRFLREAEFALGVKHPNLVETYDVGEDPDTGLCYILMEYVPGGTLADRLHQSGAMPVDDAVAVVRAMADILELGRQKGIVHRDIKPANIMFDAEGTPKLADLGIARGGINGTDTTTVTQTGMMIGTPAYMSPEQMLDAHHVDTRADIYSLGVVFFEMLTGQRPNKDDTVMQLMAKAVKGEPLPDVRTLRPDVPASFANLLSMMVAPDKDQRISTPGQITNALALIARGESFGRAKKTPWPLVQFGKIRRLPRKVLIPAGLLVLLVIIVAVLPGKKDTGTEKTLTKPLPKEEVVSDKEEVVSDRVVSEKVKVEGQVQERTDTNPSLITHHSSLVTNSSLTTNHSSLTTNSSDRVVSDRVGEDGRVEVEKGESESGVGEGNREEGIGKVVSDKVNALTTNHSSLTTNSSDRVVSDRVGEDGRVEVEKGESESGVGEGNREEGIGNRCGIENPSPSLITHHSSLVTKEEVGSDRVGSEKVKVEGQRLKVKGQTEEVNHHCLTSDLEPLTSSSAQSNNPTIKQSNTSSSSKTNAVKRVRSEKRKNDGQIRQKAKSVVKKSVPVPPPPGSPVSYFKGWSVALGKAYSEDAVSGRRGQVLTQTHVLFTRTVSIPRATGFPKPKLKLCLTVSCEPGEKSYLFVKVAGVLVGDRVISSSAYTTHEFDVSRWAGREVFIEVDCSPSERKWSRVHWQQIKVK